ncbi:MAG: hypothetical protein HC896_08580 [Bacteroidales bacterium]|nr:hypothetical protein [Bacteroidales bacterium]
MRFLNKWLYIYYAVGALFTLIVVFSPAKIYSLISKFDLTLLQENKLILYLTIPLFTLTLVNNLLILNLSSRKFFTTPQVARIINNSFALVFLVAFHKLLSVNSILIGLLIGYAINNIMLRRILKKNCNWNFSYVPYKFSKTVLSNSVMSYVGHFSKILALLYGNYLLTGLSTGVIAALNFGNRVANLANELVTGQVGGVSGVKNSELFANKEYSRINGLFLKTAAFLDYVLLPVSAMLFVFDVEIISIIYKRGAFESSSTHMVASYMRQFGLSLALVSMNTLISQLFTTAQKMKEYFVYLLIKMFCW